MAIVQQRSDRVGALVRNLALGLAVLLVLIPFYLLVRNALMTNVEFNGADWNRLPRTWEGLPQIETAP